ncbi:MAG TPA: hypothetical protein DCQ96_11770, partial [Verrucomicrobiales bacterium]|nr:hypothetical protein [Verrucomicrobiales bacterium]
MGGRNSTYPRNGPALHKAQVICINFGVATLEILAFPLVVIAFPLLGVHLIFCISHLVTVIHSTAVVSPRLKIGKNNIIGPYCVIGTDAQHT